MQTDSIFCAFVFFENLYFRFINIILIIVLIDYHDCYYKDLLNQF